MKNKFGFVCACSLVVAASSQAASIYQYAFSQGGYSGDFSGFNLTGQFSGTPDSNGIIALSNLAGFSLLGLNVMPDLFSYDVNGGALNLTFQLQTDPFNGQAACVGAPAVSGGTVGFVGCGGGGFQGIYYTYSPLKIGTTQELPQVTLLGILTGPPPASAPEPAALALFALGSLLVAAGVARSRRGFKLKNKTSPPPAILAVLARPHTHR
jgi:hypothetical protein